MRLFCSHTDSWGMIRVPLIQEPLTPGLRHLMAVRSCSVGTHGGFTRVGDKGVGVALGFFWAGAPSPGAAWYTSLSDVFGLH